MLFVRIFSILLYFLTICGMIIQIQRCFEENTLSPYNPVLLGMFGVMCTAFYTLGLLQGGKGLDKFITRLFGAATAWICLWQVFQARPSPLGWSMIAFGNLLILVGMLWLSKSKSQQLRERLRKFADFLFAASYTLGLLIQLGMFTIYGAKGTVHYWATLAVMSGFWFYNLVKYPVDSRDPMRGWIFGFGMLVATIISIMVLMQ